MVSTMQNEKQREHFRLIYPETHRPSLIMDVDNYEVENVSEYGIKFKTYSDLDFMVNDEIMATISFPDGREFDLSGHVVRLEKGAAGLQLETPLPMSVIRSETLYIMYNYPNVIN